MAFAKGFLASFSTGPFLAASPGAQCVVCCSTEQPGPPWAFAVLCWHTAHHHPHGAALRRSGEAISRSFCHPCAPCSASKGQDWLCLCSYPGGSAGSLLCNVPRNLDSSQRIMTPVIRCWLCFTMCCHSQKICPARTQGTLQKVILRLLLDIFTLHYLLMSILAGKRRALWEPDDK